MKSNRAKRRLCGDLSVSFTARLLGPTLLNGGLVLLTTRMKGEYVRHRVYVLDDLYRYLCESPKQTEYELNIQGLLEAVVRRRNRILDGTTNYFSGVTGQVVKII